MSGASIVAVGAVSALGFGEDAFHVGEIERPARVAVGHDPIFERAGLLRPVAARVSCVAESGRDRATELLSAAFEQCVSRLEPSWRGKRVGLAIGTSSGAMLTAERFFATLARGEVVSRDLARKATYFAPLDEVASASGLTFSPRVHVLGACASSTIAIGLGLRWLALDRCDIVLAGGYDALSLFVASGFESLKATTSSRPLPFRVARDGMALGEGAAIIALTREPSPRSRGWIAGFGASTDAVHLTAPDETGRGLAAAARLAIEDAGISPRDIDLVSAHATSTRFNDPAEANALHHALGAHRPAAVHPFKAQIGHTLGAAGVLETLAAVDAVVREVAPAAAGDGAIDPACAVPLRDANARFRASAALKLSSAFGGSNAALVVTRASGTGTPTRGRKVYARCVVGVDKPLAPAELTAALAGHHPHLHRLDAMARLVVSAVHLMSLSIGRQTLLGAGLLVGYTLATLEQNELFDARRRERGVRGVEPRLFPATSPNAAAGECAIAFGLTGPSFAVGGSLHGGLEALGTACDLVAAGDANQVVVVAADLDGPVSRGLLAAAGGPPLGEGALACLLGPEPGPGAFELSQPVPSTLAEGPDWIWSPPCGHVELRRYLEMSATRLAPAQSRMSPVAFAPP